METVRRNNLRRLIERFGGPSALAKKIGHSNGTYLVQLAGPNPTREISEKTARKIEESLGLAPGWMDEQDLGTDPPLDTLGVCKLARPVVEACMRLIREEWPEAAGPIPPETFAKLCELALTDAMEKCHVDEPYVKDLIQMLVSVA